MKNYISTVTDPHWREEELQWVRILETGDAVRGMVLVYLQKMCTAFHEFEPAFGAGALDESQWGFYRDRLAKRVRMVAATMQANGLEALDGYAELRRLLEAVESARSVSRLADLTEDVHALGHQLCDALERQPARG